MAFGEVYGNGDHTVIFYYLLDPWLNANASALHACTKERDDQ